VRPRVLNRGKRLAFRRHMPAIRSPTSTTRAGIVSSVNRVGSLRPTSSHRDGAEARASGVGRIE
jgi:hypothetical protein